MVLWIFDHCIHSLGVDDCAGVISLQSTLEMSILPEPDQSFSSWGMCLQVQRTVSVTPALTSGVWAEAATRCAASQLQSFWAPYTHRVTWDKVHPAGLSAPPSKNESIWCSGFIWWLMDALCQITIWYLLVAHRMAFEESYRYLFLFFIHLL